MINVKAQGSLEYLLIIGVVILISAVVIGVLTGVLSFGRIEASQEQADSVYTGLQDVMDLSKGRTILNLKLKRGENVLEFNDTVRKTIWTIFGNLPVGTTILFSGATDCHNISDINASKTNLTQYDQNTGELVNQCVVPTNTKVTINIPDTANENDLNLNIPLEKEGEIYLEITNAEDLVEAITNNPSGNYKLQKFESENAYFSPTPIPTFSGILDGQEAMVLINNVESPYLFSNLERGAVIKNFTYNISLGDDEAPPENKFFLSNNCPVIQTNNIIIDIDIDHSSFFDYKDCNNYN